jgi:hypothetical protein
LRILTINKIVITNESSRRYVFSFLERKAIQEMRIELNIVSRTDTAKNVVLKKESSSSLKKLIDKLASMKNTSIVLK